MRCHVLLMGMLLAPVVLAQPADDSALLPAEKMPLADESLLLDVVNTLQRAVAVGERGHILLSEDRQQWRQAESVPTRSTLTAVATFGDDLWAVGHDAVILHSADGGLTWDRQFANPNQDPGDDPNPLLDVFFINESRGFAIGAYGRIFITQDGGQSWRQEFIGDLIASGDAEDDDYESDEYFEEGEALTPEDMEAALEDVEDEYYDYHLNGMAQLSDGRLFIAAEAGYGYYSDDQGESWSRIEFPYSGSLFGVLTTAEDTLLAFGLRGHVFESTDGGETWQEIRTGSQSSIMGGTVTEDGRIALVGANGEVLVRNSAGSAFQSFSHPDGSDLANVVAGVGANLLIVGEDGVSTYAPGAGS
ncbi:MAG: hypothetical protein R3200_11890 [Xanthomonadales bacterium]|nr:hypothetical protein [Xanthomonadales bacterium]